MMRYTLTIAALAGIWVSTAFGLTLTWDVNGAAAGTGGTGNWDKISNTWYNGSSYIPWTDNNNAYLGGTVGTVTLTDNITIGAGANDMLTVRGTGYSINGDAGGLYKLTFDGTGGSGPYVVMIEGASPLLTINAPVKFKGWDLEFRTPVTINGVISDDGGNRKLYNHFATLTLNNANTFGGGIVLDGSNAGLLVIGNDKALGTGPLSWGSGAVIQAGNGDRVLGNVISNNTWNSEFVVSGHSGIRFTAPQTIMSGPWSDWSKFTVVESDCVLTLDNFNVNVGYGGGFEKKGAGTLAVGSFVNGSGTQAVIVTGGTLLANGPFSSHHVVVNAGAKLGGSGTVSVVSGQAVTLNAGTGTARANWGGILSPGQSPGTLTINGNLDVNNFAAYLFEPGATPATSDKVVVTGALNFLSSPTVIVKLASMMGDPTGASWTLFSYGSTTGTPSWLVDTSGTGWIGGGITQVGNSFVLSGMVPEPTALALLALAGGAIVSRRRR